MLLPVLSHSKLSAQSAKCMSNLRQLGVAAELYWDDNGGNCFSYVFAPTNYGAIYWFGWIGPGQEGQRPFDLSYGALYPYLNGSDVRLCPSLGYALAQFKLKADGVVFSYGYNFYLSAPTGKPPINVSQASPAGSNRAVRRRGAGEQFPGSRFACQTRCSKNGIIWIWKRIIPAPTIIPTAISGIRKRRTSSFATAMWVRKSLCPARLTPNCQASLSASCVRRFSSSLSRKEKTVLLLVVGETCRLVQASPINRSGYLSTS